MSIFAVERNNRVHIYNCGTKEELFSVQGKLHQYTDSTVAVKSNDDSICIYGVDKKIRAIYPHDFIDASNDIDTILQVNS